MPKVDLSHEEIGLIKTALKRFEATQKEVAAKMSGVTAADAARRVARDAGLLIEKLNAPKIIAGGSGEFERTQRWD